MGGLSWAQRISSFNKHKQHTINMSMAIFSNFVQQTAIWGGMLDMNKSVSTPTNNLGEAKQNVCYVLQMAFYLISGKKAREQTLNKFI